MLESKSDRYEKELVRWRWDRGEREERRRAKEETEKVRGVIAPVTFPLMWKLRPRDVT